MSEQNGNWKLGLAMIQRRILVLQRDIAKLSLDYLVAKSKAEGVAGGQIDDETLEVIHSESEAPLEQPSGQLVPEPEALVK